MTSKFWKGGDGDGGRERSPNPVGAAWRILVGAGDGGGDGGRNRSPEPVWTR